MISAAPPRQPGPRPWWEGHAFLAALILLSTAPLLYPPIPPLVDLLGHMGRYRVGLDLATSPTLGQWYDFQWIANGNLGVDLLVIPVARLIGLEPAVKLIVLAIPPMTVAGFLWVVREVHNRIPPTALFALPFAYGHPFLFGFVNFALSMALAFLAFGLWLRLGRLGRTRLRAILFVPISIIVYFAHTFGWGTLGLMCFSAEAVRQHDQGQRWLKAAVRAGLHSASLSLPILFILAWRDEGSAGVTTDWFNWKAKGQWALMALRDRWKAFDIASLAAVGAVALFALVHRRLGFSRNLAFSALVLIAGFLCLPRIIFGSAYADMRLVPYMFAVVVLAIRFREATHRPTAQVLAILGLVFFLVRLAGTTASLAIAADDHREKLRALDHIPFGSRVASIVGQSCGLSWPMPRNGHLGAMVMVRKHGFSNDQWVMEGLNPLRVHYPEAGRFQADPSELVEPNGCRVDGAWDVDAALRSLPREAFDYLWLIDAPPFDPRLVEGMRPVWRGPRSLLYRVNP